MKPIVYHVGLTPPPVLRQDHLQIHYSPLLDVIYKANQMPENIDKVLQLKPIIVLTSKNSVIGLEKWMSNYNLDKKYFFEYDFWTIGERTHAILHDVLGINSSFPDEMNSNGLLKKLSKYKDSKILLISSEKPRKDFLDYLYKFKYDVFHFSVYEINILIDSIFFRLFADSKNNFVVFTSPSSIDGLQNNLDISDLSKIQCRLISIGPTTSTAIVKNGGNVFYESTVQNIKILYRDFFQIKSAKFI